MMIPYSEFGHLRLASFLPKDDIARVHSGWEFQGHLWHGEALGCSEWPGAGCHVLVLQSVSWTSPNPHTQPHAGPHALRVHKTWHPRLVR